LRHPEHKDEQVTIYFDWSMQRGLAVIGDEGWVADVQNFHSIDALLDTITEPTTLVSETTFESFNVDNRMAALGHTWLVLPTKLTPRARAVLGLEKDDSNDVLAIRHVARTNPDALKRPTVDSPIAEKLTAANRELMILRRTYTTEAAPRRKYGLLVRKQKDAYAETVLQFLPEYADLDDYLKVALGDGKKYSLTLVAAIAKATKHAESRREFDSLAGLHVNGYPSQIRSDLHHWRWRFIRKARDERGANKLTISEYRRACRWLYHQLAPHRVAL
jgi:hypothetical protein